MPAGEELENLGLTWFVVMIDTQDLSCLPKMVDKKDLGKR